MFYHDLCFSLRGQLCRRKVNLVVVDLLFSIYLHFFLKVSWLRHDDTHLLTIGRLTYTSDMRFKAIHKLYSEDYLLQIKPTTHRDSGKYACQISTTPPNSHIVTLTIAGNDKLRTTANNTTLLKSCHIFCCHPQRNRNQTFTNLSREHQTCSLETDLISSWKSSLIHLWEFAWHFPYCIFHEISDKKHTLECQSPQRKCIECLSSRASKAVG